MARRADDDGKYLSTLLGRRIDTDDAIKSIPSARFLGRRDFEAMTVVADVTQKATVSALSVENVSHAYGARIALDR